VPGVQDWEGGQPEKLGVKRAGWPAALGGGSTPTPTPSTSSSYPPRALRCSSGAGSSITLSLLLPLPPHSRCCCQGGVGSLCNSRVPLAAFAPLFPRQGWAMNVRHHHCHWHHTPSHPLLVPHRPCYCSR